MAYNTPILLITFNRTDHVRRLLEEVRKIQPKYIYIAQDGPRADRQDDVNKIQAVRDVINEMVDWPCNLHTHYSQKNLGCGRGPYEAISWFFSHVEGGIILEDDIVPHPLFFPYMAELLERYKEDERVGMVTGHNLTRDYSFYNSYYFTFIPDGTLGWGTWRRVWKDFDFNIPYNEQQLKSALSRIHIPHNYVRRECANNKKWLSGSRHDCWDYQFDFYIMVNGFLNARANSCLTSHEGDDKDATHTGYENPGYKMDVDESRFIPIRHPKKVKIDSSEYRRVIVKEIKLVVKSIFKK